VLNDVTITQASAVWELADTDPDQRRLFSRAMRIGRDHIASTVYTIAFATAGAVLPVLLLIAIYDRPLLQVIQSEQFAAEVIRTLVGSIGLVLAVPLTTAVGVAVVRVSGRGRQQSASVGQGARGSASRTGAETPAETSAETSALAAGAPAGLTARLRRRPARPAEPLDTDADTDGGNETDAEAPAMDSAHGTDGDTVAIDTADANASETADANDAEDARETAGETEDANAQSTADDTADGTADDTADAKNSDPTEDAPVDGPHRSGTVGSVESETGATREPDDETPPTLDRRRRFRLRRRSKPEDDFDDFSDLRDPVDPEPPGRR